MTDVIKLQKKAENIGAFISNCGGCGRKYLTGYMTGYTPGILSSCKHCQSDMCVRCDKGALCVDCLSSAPLEVQKSCLRNRNVFKSIYLGFIVLFIVTYVSGIMYWIITQIPVNFSTHTFLVTMLLISAFGVIPAYFLMKLGYARWYNKHVAEMGYTWAVKQS